MTKKNVAKNYLYNVTYHILAIIIPLITTPYLSRVLGAEKIGIHSYTLSITTYFILFGSLGVSIYGQREIAYTQNDVLKRSKSFYEIFMMKCFTMILSLLVFYSVFCINGEYSAYYKILILEVIANLIDISWFFQGLEEFKKTVIRNMMVKIISVICIFIFIKNAYDLNKYMYIYVLSNFLCNLSLWLYLPSFVKKVKFKDLKVFKHLRPTISLFIPQIAIQIYTVLDKTMIGTIIVDKAEVGYYDQAQKMIKLLLTIATSFGTVMMPRIAALYSSGNMNMVKKYVKKAFSFVMLLAFPLMFGMISVSSKFVPLFYGPGYDKVIILICIICPIILFIGISNVVGVQYLLPTKQQKKYTFSVIIGAIINFIFNLMLIYSLKSIGASIATVIAELSVTIVQLVLIRKEISILELFKSIYKYCIASIIMFFISITIGVFISNNLISIVFQIICSAMVYFLLLLLFKDLLITDGIDLFKNKIKELSKSH